MVAARVIWRRRGQAGCLFDLRLGSGRAGSVALGANVRWRFARTWGVDHLRHSCAIDERLRARVEARELQREPALTEGGRSVRDDAALSPKQDRACAQHHLEAEDDTLGARAGADEDERRACDREGLLFEELIFAVVGSHHAERDDGLRRFFRHPPRLTTFRGRCPPDVGPSGRVMCKNSCRKVESLGFFRPPPRKPRDNRIPWSEPLPPAQNRGHGSIVTSSCARSRRGAWPSCGSPARSTCATGGSSS